MSDTMHRVDWGKSGKPLSFALNKLNKEACHEKEYQIFLNKVSTIKHSDANNWRKLS
jgi:hypothetical protein